MYSGGGAQPSIGSHGGLIESTHGQEQLFSQLYDPPTRRLRSHPPGNGYKVANSPRSILSRRSLPAINENYFQINRTCFLIANKKN